MTNIFLLVAALFMGSSEGLMSPCNFGNLIIINGVTSRELVNTYNCGTAVNLTELSYPPLIRYTPTVGYDKYTLLMIGTNQTNQSKPYTFLNWLVTNITPNNTFITGPRIKNSTELASYMKPTTEGVPGMNKYMFVLYKQQAYRPPLWRALNHSNRFNFSVELWLRSYPVDTFIGPVAGSELKLFETVMRNDQKNVYYVNPSAPLSPTMATPRKNSADLNKFHFLGYSMILVNIIYYL